MAQSMFPLGLSESYIRIDKVNTSIALKYRADSSTAGLSKTGLLKADMMALVPAGAIENP